MPQFVTPRGTRRSFLRAGSTLLAVPFLETHAKSQDLAASPPKRVLFLGGGFGFTKDTFYPTSAGRFSDIGMTEGLTPLKRHQNDISMVTNLTNMGASNPHGGSLSYLTGANVAGTSGKRFHNSVSCDQVLAGHLGTDTRFASLTLSANEADGNSNSGHGGGLSLAWDESGNPIPGIARPIDLYYTLFANAKDSKEELSARLKKTSEYSRHCATRRERYQRTLSKTDNLKLDEYFTGVRQVEKGLERQAQWADIPKPQAPMDAPPEGISGEEANPTDVRHDDCCPANRRNPCDHISSTR